MCRNSLVSNFWKCKVSGISTIVLRDVATAFMFKYSLVDSNKTQIPPPDFSMPWLSIKCLLGQFKGMCIMDT